MDQMNVEKVGEVCKDCKGCNHCKCGSCGKCGCGHHMVIPALAVLIGVDFLLGTFGVFTAQTVDVIWPILLIIAAGSTMMGSKCKCC